MQWKPVSMKNIDPWHELLIVKLIDKNSHCCMNKNIKPHHKVQKIQYIQIFIWPHKNCTLASLIHQLEVIKKAVPAHAGPQQAGMPFTIGHVVPVQISKHKL